MYLEGKLFLCTVMCGLVVLVGMVMVQHCDSNREVDREILIKVNEDITENVITLNHGDKDKFSSGVVDKDSNKNDNKNVREAVIKKTGQISECCRNV